MVIEFQMTRAKFQTLLRNRAILARPCVEDSFSMLGETYYLSSIDMGQTDLSIATEPDTIQLNALLPGGKVGVPATGAIEVTRKRLQVRQALTLQMASLTAMKASNAAQCATTNVAMTLVLDVRINVTSMGVPQLCLSASTVEGLNLPDPAAATAIINTVNTILANCSDFDLTPVAQAANLPTTPVVVNAGIAASKDLSRVSIRMERC